MFVDLPLCNTASPILLEIEEAVPRTNAG